MVRVGGMGLVVKLEEEKATEVLEVVRVGVRGLAVA
jgi:hypothetical protein